MRALMWAVAVLIAGTAIGQRVIHGEYWVGQDLGFGLNTSFQFPAAQDTLLELAIDLSGLPPGSHIVGFRMHDDSARWGLTQFRPVLITEAPNAADLERTEVFVNNDLGFGQGQVLWSGSAPDTADVSAPPDLTAAVEGHNTLFVRSRSSDGRWGITNTTPLVVIAPAEAGLIDAVEAFVLDGQPDPGFGFGAPFTSFPPSIDIADTLTSDGPFPLYTGLRLAVRSHDTSGQWSHTNFIDSIIVEFHDDVAILLQSSGVAVFPNPFADSFTVQPGESGPVRLVLYDPRGALVMDRSLTTTTTIDLQGLSNGAYTAFFWRGDARIHRTTLIKR